MRDRRNGVEALGLLILGGTTEASALAAALAPRADIRAMLSLAGRVANPTPAPIPMRVGGFGGVAGLIAHIRRERVEAIIDATHPFAEQISANAALACAAAGIPRLVFTRPPWRRLPGDRWIEVETIEAAVAALGQPPRRVFLTHGRLQLAPFARAPQHRYLVRAIERPTEIDALPGAELILARGPFSLADEQRLMGDQAIEILVTKNSGGASTYPKLEAARQLGVDVVIVRRPAGPDVETVTSLDGALAWIEARRP